MSQPTVDLGLKLVHEEIDNALACYQNGFYQETFAIPEFRQKLVDYVMKKIQGVYKVVECAGNPPIKFKFPYRSLELRLRVERHIYQGIHHILQNHSDLVIYPFNQEAQLSY